MAAGKHSMTKTNSAPPPLSKSFSYSFPSPLCLTLMFAFAITSASSYLSAQSTPAPSTSDPVAIDAIWQKADSKYDAARRQILEQVDRQAHDGPFRPDWESLQNYQIPTWYQDAKFGIFIHWGLYSVPAFGSEWYSRNMYEVGSDEYKHHIATYGPQSKFGYKDFIPLFKAEHFDADAWIDLFARAGARYIVPVAEHCDGFAMYDSAIDPWNAAKMGPHRDIVGALETATRKRGLHFGVSSHRAEHWWWYDGGMQFDSDVRDPRYAVLYGPAQPRTLPGQAARREPDPNHLETWLAPNTAFTDDWLARSAELVDKYHPDFLYFDWWIGQPAFQPYLQRFAAYYYNQAAARKQGPDQGVVLTYKMNDFP